MPRFDEDRPDALTEPPPLLPYSGAAPTGVNSKLSSMFEDLPIHEGGPVFALNDSFRQDARSCKANLGIGVYCNDAGQTPVLESIKGAAGALLQAMPSCNYLPVEGAANFRDAAQEFVFGQAHGAVVDRRIATLQTIGGSGALRVGAEFLSQSMGVRKIWVSDPTWDNHRSVFQGAGLRVETFAYHDADTGALRFDDMLNTLDSLPERSVVLFHACCHNPTGMDLTRHQWEALVPKLLRRRIVPFIDMAYQGFGDDVEEDAFGVRCIGGTGMPLLLANSFSKNFSLYGERCGSLHVVCEDAPQVPAVLSQLKAVVIRTYFSPPAHGSQLVATVLRTPELRQMWHGELTVMRDRVKKAWYRLHRELLERSSDGHWDRIIQQRGMFAYTGMSPIQVHSLRYVHGVYLAPSGRLLRCGLERGNHCSRRTGNGHRPTSSQISFRLTK